MPFDCRWASFNGFSACGDPCHPDRAMPHSSRLGASRRPIVKTSFHDSLTAESPLEAAEADLNDRPEDDGQRPTTAYDAGQRPVPEGQNARSWWTLISVGLLLLAIITSGFLLMPFSRPAPSTVGSPGSGIINTPSPAQPN
jgi:hypothetical protein